MQHDLGGAPQLLAWLYDEFFLPGRVVMSEAALGDLEQHLNSFFADFEEMLEALGDDRRRALPHPIGDNRAAAADLLTLCETTLTRLFDARLMVEQGQRPARPRESATAAHLAHDAAVALAQYAPHDGAALRKALLEAVQWRHLYRRQRVVLRGPNGRPVFGQRAGDRPPDFFDGPRAVSWRSALVAADLVQRQSRGEVLPASVEELVQASSRDMHALAEPQGTPDEYVIAEVGNLLLDHGQTTRAAQAYTELRQAPAPLEEAPGVDPTSVLGLRLALQAFLDGDDEEALALLALLPPLPEEPDDPDLAEHLSDSYQALCPCERLLLEAVLNNPASALPDTVLLWAGKSQGVWAAWSLTESALLLAEAAARAGRPWAARVVLKGTRSVLELPLPKRDAELLERLVSKAAASPPPHEGGPADVHLVERACHALLDGTLDATAARRLSALVDVTRRR